jgi:hypothetical protein
MKKSTDLYRVIPGRVLHHVIDGRAVAWAGPGEIVRLDHPVLVEAAAGQEYKLESMKGVPKGQTVREELPALLAARVIEYDRMQSRGESSSRFPDVSRPISELEKALAEAEKRNSELERQLMASTSTTTEETAKEPKEA